MKIRINLLPNDYREERKITKKIASVRKFLLGIFFALGLLSVVLFAMVLILMIESRAAKEMSSEAARISQQEVIESEKILKDINNITKKVNKIESQVPRWSKLLDLMDAVRPEGLRITQIAVEGQAAKISGFSKSRDGFVEFKEKLEAADAGSVTSPISNLTAPEDIRFELTIEVKKEFLEE